MKQIKLSHKTKQIRTTIELESSKSESNRALLIQAFSKCDQHLENLSNANDTVLLNRLLNSTLSTLDVEDAGTSYRFLTAYYALRNGIECLTGTERMKERPIAILVDALNRLGADITYLEKEGFPPLKISPIKHQLTNQLEIDASVSSQYVSALLLIAPELPEGLELKLIGKVSSKPYIQMTINLMEHFGAEIEWVDEIIKVKPQNFKERSYIIESDWSGASYWYSIVALSENAEIELKGLRKESQQGDSAIVDIMKSLGVSTEFLDNSVILRKSESVSSFSYDFSDCPDLALAVIVLCGIKSIKSEFKGLESLFIKETNRVLALQNELKKFGVLLIERDGVHVLEGEEPKLKANVTIETYLDHRIAMAFAPIGLLVDHLEIINPDVVNKSYPSFWEDLKLADFKIESNDE